MFSKALFIFLEFWKKIPISIALKMTIKNILFVKTICQKNLTTKLVKKLSKKDLKIDFFFTKKEHFPNLLESALLHQIFVFWVRDFKQWLLAYFLISFKCKVSGRLDNLGSRHFIRGPPLMFIDFAVY